MSQADAANNNINTDRSVVADEISTEQFRDVMCQLAAAVTLIATDGPAGRHGMTASAVCSVTDDPPTILVCINRSSAMNEVIKNNGVMSVNILTAHQRALSLAFANRSLTIDERFAKAEWTNAVTSAPLLTDAALSLDCEIESFVEVGTHSVFFGRLRAIQDSHTKEPLLYYQRAFHTVAAQALA